MEENNFEKFPVSKEVEQSVPVGQDFEEAMGSGVPEFAGDDFMASASENESIEDATESEEYDAGISDAAALINYGLDAAAREMGVEVVVQKIKGFDPSGSEDPIGDFFRCLGIDSPVERKDLHEESMANKPNEAEFRDGANAPSLKRSYEGAFKAIADMKELIAEVEGADPRYDELRAGAKAAGKGYFEYAVSNYGKRGLTELFSVLSQQGEKAEEEKNEDDGNNSETDELGDKPENDDETPEKEEAPEALNPEILK